MGIKNEACMSTIIQKSPCIKSTTTPEPYIPSSIVTPQIAASKPVSCALNPELTKYVPSQFINHCSILQDKQFGKYGKNINNIQRLDADVDVDTDDNTDDQPDNAVITKSTVAVRQTSAASKVSTLAECDEEENSYEVPSTPNVNILDITDPDLNFKRAVDNKINNRTKKNHNSDISSSNSDDACNSDDCGDSDHDSSDNEIE